MSSPLPAFSVDPASSATLYDQVRTQLLDRIADGTLIAGTRLPPVRELAASLGVAPYTVARVYRLLEQDGVLETRGRNGTVVRGAGSAEATLQREASAYAARARELGIGADDALAFVRAALGA